MTGRSLRYHGLKPRTKKAYLKAVHDFFTARRCLLLPRIRTFADLDDALALRLSQMWQEGEPMAYAGHLMSAVQRFLPAAKPHVLTAKQFYSNWRGNKFVARAFPMPLRVLFSMMGAAIRVNRLRLAATLLLAFFDCLRSSEFLGLKRQDCLIDTKRGVIILALEGAKTSGAALESVVIRSVPLAMALHFLLADVPPEALIFPGGWKVFRNDLRLLEEVAPRHPYGLFAEARWCHLASAALRQLGCRNHKGHSDI